MRIGIDVGGTNTDAVLMDGSTVISWAKQPTSADISTGITAALQQVLASSGVTGKEIEIVIIGTTHFTNALVERKGLREVGIIRIGTPAGDALPPKVGWPEDLQTLLGEHTFLVPGGYNFDGKEISSFDQAKVECVARTIAERNLQAVAISCVFSPVNDKMEKQTAALLREIAPDIDITLSSEIGKVGLLERENAAMLNAALTGLSYEVVKSFRHSLQRLKLDVPFYITQNDGTMMSAEYVEKYPVLTFVSGPTNSMRGAAFLSGLSDALVIDIGGTTSDIGIINEGFPRESGVSVDIGGVSTNFRMPDILALGMGGGSLVRQMQGVEISIGPDSVGHRLTSEALIFGGDSTTLTDVMVAAGDLVLGDPVRVGKLDKKIVKQCKKYFHAQLEEGIDRVKLKPGDMSAILVGGGSILVSDKLKGVSEVIRPDYASVANAIGAATAQVGGEVDRIFSLNSMDRSEVISTAKQEASDKVLAAGGNADTLKIIELEETAIAYLSENCVRMRVKAVGDLAA